MRRKAEISEMLLPLLQSETTALSTLANEGPTNTYQIAKKTGKSYSLMFKAIKTLEERYLIRLVEKKKTSKGTTSNSYDLSFMGILTVLARELSPEDTKQWNYNQVHKIIRKYDYWLPLVFGKWSFFQEAGVEKIALLRLKEIVDRLKIERICIFDLIGYGGPLVPGADVKSLVEWLFYFIGLVPTEGKFEQDWQIRHDTEAWIDALKQDKDIVAYFLEELEFYQHTLRYLSDLGEKLERKFIGTNKHEEDRGKRTENI